MNTRHFLRLLGATVACAALLVPLAFAADDEGPAPSAAKAVSDNIQTPQSERQDALRQAGLQQQLDGTIPADSKVVKVAKGQYVELALEGEDQIFTLLGEFGDAQATTTTAPGTIGHGGTPGPLHNQIPQPDRTRRQHDDLDRRLQPGALPGPVFDKGAGAVRWRTSTSSSPRAATRVNGDVSDWVKVPFNEARYGSNYCGSIVCTRDVGRFIDDQGDAWYDAQIAARQDRRRDQGLPRAVRQVWDRYDYDGDGNFNEPDGYIDHFQSVHAGEGEEAGGGAQGTDAIWSHRWYANGGAQRRRPGVGGVRTRLGGVRIGNTEHTGSATTPSSPRTAASACSRTSSATTSACPTCTTPAATPAAPRTAPPSGRSCRSGSWQRRQPTTASATTPVDMGAWEKLQLGWLELRRSAHAGQKATYKLGPAETNTKKGQALIVVLPDKKVTTESARRSPAAVLLLGFGQRPRQHDDQADHARRRSDQRCRSPAAGRSRPAGTTRTSRSRPTAARPSPASTRPHRRRSTRTARTSASASPARRASRTCATRSGPRPIRR